MSDVKLFCGDCLDILPTLTGIDAVITDPPYGIDYSTGWLPETIPGDFYSVTGNGSIINDRTTEMRDFIISWAKDNNKPAAVFGSSRIPDPEGYAARLVWDKGEAAGMGDLSIPWKPNYDFIHIFGRAWTGKRNSSVLRATNIPRISMGRLHPHEKPVSLLVQIIEKLPRGYVVLDPFMGSGSTGEACIRAGYDFIGIESDPGYFAIAQKRIAAAQMQPRLEGLE